jgi:alpha-glucosidase (family GH31 glycosyl hydrolase)
VWQKAKANHFSKGIRTFWLDEAEPELGVYDFDNYRYHLARRWAFDGPRGHSIASDA